MAHSASKDVLATHFMTKSGTEWYSVCPGDHHVNRTVQQVEDLLKGGQLPHMSALKDADGAEWDTGPDGVKPR